MELICGRCSYDRWMLKIPRVMICTGKLSGGNVVKVSVCVSAVVNVYRDVCVTKNALFWLYFVSIIDEAALE